MAISDNTSKINELITKINSLPVAGSGSGGSDGVSPTIEVEPTDDGHIIIITDVNGTQTFFVANGQDGPQGDPGEDGVGISSIEQTTASTSDSGTNVITVTLSNGKTSTFNVRNGAKGSTGETGAPGADGANGADGVGIASIEQTTTSTANGGTNKITATLTNGQTSVFNIKNGTKGSTGATGATGADGVSITSVDQTTTSAVDGGTNVITVTLSNGQKFSFNVKNGSKGSNGAAGSAGANATINGVNTLTLNTGAGLTKTQSGSTMTISANYEYGQTDLTAGFSSLETGKLYFVYE